MGTVIEVLVILGAVAVAGFVIYKLVKKSEPSKPGAPGGGGASPDLPTRDDKPNQK